MQYAKVLFPYAYPRHLAVTRTDVAIILTLIGELAAYENFISTVTASEEFL